MTQSLNLLIGPSGAGKSTFAKNMELGLIISSDEFRANMTGNAQDMSLDSIIWREIYDIAENLLLKHHVIAIDATNLRTKTRRKFLSIAPPTCNITYWIIDRPMSEKERDGGWRLGVEVNGVPLMHWHSTLFHQNLPDILAGDNDSRVTVKDMRSKSCK